MEIKGNMQKLGVMLTWAEGRLWMCVSVQLVTHSSSQSPLLRSLLSSLGTPILNTSVCIKSALCSYLKFLLSLNYSLSVQHMLWSLKAAYALKSESSLLDSVVGGHHLDLTKQSQSQGVAKKKKKKKKKKLQDPLSMGALSWSVRLAAQSVSACCLALISLLYLTHQLEARVKDKQRLVSTFWAHLA